MYRRSFIAGVATLAAVSGCLEFGSDGTESDSSGESNSSREREGEGAAVEIATLEAPGSDAGTVSVPTPGRLLLVNCIRITCPTSRAMLSRVGEARDRLAETHDVGPDGDIHVVTVVDEHSGTEPTAEELADWWAEQDGDWTIGVDADGALFEALEVASTPTTVAVDENGTDSWRDEGGTTASNLVSGVERTLEGEDEDDSNND